MRGIIGMKVRHEIENSSPDLHTLMGWIIGLEPTTSRATIWRSSQLNYIHHILLLPQGMARLEGLEPPTHCLEGSCSIHLSYRRG